MARAGEFRFHEAGWQEVQTRVDLLLSGVSKNIRDDAARLAPYNKDPRANAKPHTHLKDSIEIDRRSWQWYRIGSPLDYSASVEFGSRPHMIPHAFGRPGAVHHPGHIEPQPFLRPAAYVPRFPGGNL